MILQDQPDRDARVVRRLPEHGAAPRLAALTKGQARTLVDIARQVDARRAALRVAARDLALATVLALDDIALLSRRADQMAAALAATPVTDTPHEARRHDLIAEARHLGVAAATLRATVVRAVVAETDYAQEVVEAVARDERAS